MRSFTRVQLLLHDKVLGNDTLVADVAKEVLHVVYGAETVRCGRQEEARCAAEDLLVVEVPEGQEVAAHAFQGSAVASVTVPVASIGRCAFLQCRALVQVELKGVARIGNSAFYGCTALQRIELPEALRELGQGAFGECSALEAVKIPSGVAEVPYAAFKGCSSLTHLELSEARGCYDLAAVF